jgi:DNA-binding transcriptional ArsR family regulator
MSATRYAVCPTCRTVTPLDAAHTISEAAYHTWLFVRGTPGRIDLHGAALELDVSYMTVHRHLNALADAGLVKRAPMGSKYAKRQRHTYEVEALRAERGEAVRDAGAAGEGETDSRAPVRAGA